MTLPDKLLVGLALGLLIVFVGLVLDNAVPHKAEAHSPCLSRVQGFRCVGLPTEHLCVPVSVCVTADGALTYE